MIWYTSDTHWGHQAIIDYCNRPFRTLDGQFDLHGMNEEMIKRWNARVKLDDTVIHIGDFSLYLGSSEQGWLLTRLNGNKVLVLGNHDRSAARMKEVGFIDAKMEMRVADGPYHLYLRHKPNFEFDDKEFDYHLCGHVHEKWKRPPVPYSPRIMNRIINVGVDQWNFEPKTIEELVTLSG